MMAGGMTCRERESGYSVVQQAYFPFDASSFAS